MTSSCSSKTDFICVFSYVFRCGRFFGSSRLEVSHLYLFDISPLPLLNISIKLEFALIGVHLQKLWQFRVCLFLLEFICCVAWAPWFCQGGSTAPSAVVPCHGSTAGKYRTHYRKSTGLCGSGHGTGPR